MTSTVELIKQDILKQLEDLAAKRLPEPRARLVRSFTQVLYDDVVPAELCKERADHLYAAAVSLLSFIEQWDGKTPVVRLFSPSLDDYGWRTPHTVLELVQQDVPFLVDSVSAELARLGAEIQLFFHPIAVVHRNEQGEVTAVDKAAVDSKEGLVSVMHIRMRAVGKERFAELQESVLRVIADVRAAVDDFPQMRSLCGELVSRLRETRLDVPQHEQDEIADFLDWLNERHFTYLGYRYCTFISRTDRLSVHPATESGLGVLRAGKPHVFDDFQPASAGELLRIFKANVRSTVHRPVHLDAVVITDHFNLDSSTRGAHMFVGLFTLSAYARSTENIPLLRQKVQRITESTGFLPDGHDAKTLKFILETYPRDELFQTGDEDLRRIALGILHLRHRQRVAFFPRADPFGRFVSCLVYLPRDRMDTRLRMKVAAILTDAYKGSLSAYYTHLADEPLARLHMIIKTTESSSADPSTIERRLHEATRSWEDRLEAALVNELGEELGGARSRTYARAFSLAYQETFDELIAVTDIDFIQRAIDEDQMTMHLYRPVECAQHQLSLKIFLPKGRATLSDIVPKLENMGLRVVGEVPYEVKLVSRDGSIRLHDFTLVTEDDVPVSLSEVREAFIDVFRHVWHGSMGNDGFNKLVLHAGLSSRQVKLIRAYANYLWQLRSPFSLAYMQRTLKRYPEIVRLLVRMFEVSFDPDATVGANGASLTVEQRKAEGAQLHKHILKNLDGIESLDEDRILRGFVNLVSATLRTNHYQLNPDGSSKHYVSLKFDARSIPEVPNPRPFAEVFVFGPSLQGTHLRFGPVARGGLRWSDREEDFRTEILGLVKAQQVKNAVIVPVGSKGGFVMSNPPPAELGRAAYLEAGIATYKTFIAGLLDVTDNRQGATIVHPERVVVHDGPDPYLVVAADKGTATFSDLANEISTSFGFWLGDAFASGGSAGYDHKKMGITARGAWESVKRHFRELGKDIQRETFTCCGVGDMSGDVFGNGMLLSRQTRLVAAFNHLHIFIDPDPDPESSWLERKRLFDLPRSSWADYDGRLLSPGGGIFERRAKTIALSEQARTLLGLGPEPTTPADVIRAILRCDAELLFFGGIGTYVKGSAESNADVGDRANDAVRVDGNELRVKVVGEGANLGMTQRGRVEYCLDGGSCYTDFIDNSAGVDCSDHEVNLKILLTEVENSGDLTRKQRNQLLVEMTDQVASRVLSHNYSQTQTLNVTHSLGSRLTDRLGRIMRTLERAGKLDRALECLPNEEVMAERVRRRIGFTKPELAVLLAYAKNELYATLLDSTVPDDPFTHQALLAYFPSAVQSRFPRQIEGHQLRREIVATVLTNDVLNRGGLGFVHEAAEAAGASHANAVRAFVVAQEVLQMKKLTERIDALDSALVPRAQTALLVECGRCLTALTVWLLKAHKGAFSIVELIEHYSGGVESLIRLLRQDMPPSEVDSMNRRSAALTDLGAPEDLARDVAMLPLLAPAGDLVQLSLSAEVHNDTVAHMYFEVGERFGLSWLRSVAKTLPTERVWDRQAVASVLDELSVTQRGLVLAILTHDSLHTDQKSRIEEWCEDRAPLVKRNGQLIADLRATASHNFAMLAVANGQLKSLLPDARTPPDTGPGSVRRLPRLSPP